MSEVVAVGSRILHRGHTDFKVVGLEKHHKGTVIATFENERYKVKCVAAELVHDKTEGAFYLPGRREKMVGELTVEQAIAVGVKKGNLSPEAAERKRGRFAKLIEAEKREAERLEAEKKKLEAERAKSDG